MDDLYIYHKNFGKCKVLAFEKNIAIIKLERNYEQYVVTIGLSKKTNSWQQGFYFKTYDSAMDIYNFFVAET